MRVTNSRTVGGQVPSRESYADLRSAAKPRDIYTPELASMPCALQVKNPPLIGERRRAYKLKSKGNFDMPVFSRTLRPRGSTPQRAPQSSHGASSSRNRACSTARANRVHDER